MDKRGWISLLAACALLVPSWACAQVYEGVTVSVAEQAITAPGGGTLERLALRVGQAVAAGEQVGQTAARKVFATQDGVVASVSAEAGQEADGTVLALEPTNRYVVYCTVDGAYDSPETQLVHSGEQVYLRCVKNGTHRAVGLVTAVSAEEYTVEVIGGELYVGEAVAVYREEGFTAAS